MALFEIPEGKKRLFTISPTDTQKNPTKVEDGSVVFSVDGDNAAAFTVTPVGGDQLAAWVAKTGANGAAKLKVSADADLGAGVKTITDEADLFGTSGEASSLGLSAGDAVDQ